MLQVAGEMTGEDGLGSQSYVPFSLPKDPDAADDATKYVCLGRVECITCRLAVPDPGHLSVYHVGGLCEHG